MVCNFAPGTDAFVLAKDDMGLWLTTDESVFGAMAEQFIGESKAVKSARQVFVEAHAKFVPERAITKQRVQFKMAVITPESAEDKGRAIKKDMIDIVEANEKDAWFRMGGTRYPNDKCNGCCMRGICASRPDLRDMLLERRQVDEFRILDGD